MDASFNNLPNTRSQGGFLVYLSDKFSYIAPIAWSSTNLKHVAQSTLAAETLALLDGCDMPLFTASFAKEIIYPKCSKDIRIKGYTDNHSLKNFKHNKVNPGQTLIHLIEKQYQLSDVLTKKGAPHQSLTETLQKGKIE